RVQLLLRLSLETGIANEDREHEAGAAEEIFRRNARGAPAAHQFPIRLQALQERGSESGLVATAERSGDGIAVGPGEALAIRDPGDRPFDPSGPAGEGCAPGKGLRGDRLAAL